MAIKDKLVIYRWIKEEKRKENDQGLEKGQKNEWKFGGKIVISD